MDEVDVDSLDVADESEIDRWRAGARPKRRHPPRVNEPPVLAVEPDRAPAMPVHEADAELRLAQAELQAAVIPRDPDDDRDVILEVKAFSGGDQRDDLTLVVVRGR